MNENLKFKINLSTFLSTGVVVRDLEKVAYASNLDHRPFDNVEKKNFGRDGEFREVRILMGE